MTKFMAIGSVVFDVEQISGPGCVADSPISRFARADRIECVDSQICRLLFLFVCDGFSVSVFFESQHIPDKKWVI